MTIDAIFERYEVPRDIQSRALTRGALALAIRDAWVGPEVTWPIIVKAMLFASLGDPATSAHIRKKVGLDKYTGTLIARGMPPYADTIATGHDWHQKVYAYCLWRNDTQVPITHGDAWATIRASVEENLMREIPSDLVLTPNIEHTLRRINVLHYKNPSV